MRKLLEIRFLSIIAISLMCVSCANNEKNCEAIADTFLNSYFKNDYKKALSLCDENLSIEIEKALNNFENLEEDIQKDLKEKSALVKTEISEVIIQKDNKNYCIVKYNIFIPEVNGSITNSLILEKRDKEWKITALNV